MQQSARSPTGQIGRAQAIIGQRIGLHRRPFGQPLSSSCTSSSAATWPTGHIGQRRQCLFGGQKQGGRAPVSRSTSPRKQPGLHALNFGLAHFGQPFSSVCTSSLAASSPTGQIGQGFGSFGSLKTCLGGRASMSWLSSLVKSEDSANTVPSAANRRMYLDEQRNLGVVSSEQCSAI